MGPLIGQVVHVTAMERKTPLAAGVCAGMTATFGSPVSAVSLAMNLPSLSLSLARLSQ